MQTIPHTHAHCTRSRDHAFIHTPSLDAQVSIEVPPSLLLVRGSPQSFVMSFGADGATQREVLHFGATAVAPGTAIKGTFTCVLCFLLSRISFEMMPCVCVFLPVGPLTCLSAHMPTHPPACRPAHPLARPSAGVSACRLFFLCRNVPISIVFCIFARSFFHAPTLPPSFLSCLCRYGGGKKGFLNVPLQAGDIVRPCKITTETFGGSWDGPQCVTPPPPIPSSASPS
jgi:hypothetical protein